MKFIAGSVLMGFGLMSLTIGSIDIYEGRKVFMPDYFLDLGGPINFLAIMFILVGISLFIWELWGLQRSKKT